MQKEFVKSNKQERRSRIVSAAIQLIAKDGFSNMNLDQVVNLAGTSKSAVYELFENKEGLLKAVCEKTLFDSRQIFSEAVTIEMPVGEYLLKYIDLYVDLCHTPSYIAVIRSVFSEAAKSPSIGKYYFNLSPARTVSELAQYFTLKVSQGLLRPMNCVLTSRQMVGALVWYQEASMLCITDQVPDIQEMREHAHALLDNFMNTYAI